MRAHWEGVMEARKVCAACTLAAHWNARARSLTHTLRARSCCTCALQLAQASDAKRGISAEDDGSAAKYMRGVLLDERRWAFFYRRGRFTLGIASTQRCEGFFAKLKLELGRIGSLRHLATTLVKIVECDAAESAILLAALRTRQNTNKIAKVRAGLWGSACCTCTFAPLQLR
jgi:hypothetical protein